MSMVLQLRFRLTKDFSRTVRYYKRYGLRKTIAALRSEMSKEKPRDHKVASFAVTNRLASPMVEESILLRVSALFPNNPYSVVLYRLLYYQDIVNLTRDIPGSIVECGVGSGRTLAMLALLTKSINLQRKIWGYDSFEGLPKPSSEDLLSSRSIAEKGLLRFSEGVKGVLESLRIVGINEDTIRNDIKIVKGWFSDTLPTYDGPPIAILHLDADLYESTKCILEYLWSRVASGGVAMFDEYHQPELWPGEKVAVDEYFAQNARNVKVVRDRFSNWYYTIKK